MHEKSSPSITLSVTEPDSMGVFLVDRSAADFRFLARTGFTTPSIGSTVADSPLINAPVLIIVVILSCESPPTAAMVVAASPMILSSAATATILGDPVAALMMIISNKYGIA